MKLNSPIIILFATITLIIVFMMTSSYRKTSNMPSQAGGKSAQTMLRDMKANLWDNYVPYVVEDDFKKLDSSTLVIDSIGKRKKLSELVKGKYSLVIRYSPTDCNICVDTITSIVKQLEKHVGTDQIIAITNAKTERAFMVLMKSRPRTIPTYSLLDSDLGLHMEHKNFPFLFMITPDFRVIKILIPSKELPMQTRAYLVKSLRYLDVQNRQK